MAWEAVEKRLRSAHARFTQLGAFGEVPLVDADDDEGGKAGEFYEEDVGGVQCAWGEDESGGLEDEEGENVEGRMVGEEGVGVDA
jgi:hypothetical protein